MKYHLLLCCSLFLTSLLAQNKHDYIWLRGYHRGGFHPPGTLMDFNTPEVTIAPSNLLGGMGNSVIMSDTAGRLLFYSDGCMVMNRQHQMMADGDSINSPGSKFWGHCILDSTGYTSLTQGMVAVPYPGRPGQYVMFHLRHSQGTWGPGYLHYTIVDMNAENGLGRVIRKNEHLLSTEFDDGITAVRHGNGRDWWMVAPAEGDTYYLFLLSPSGIEGPFERHGGYPPQALARKSSQAVFSPDGTRYARISGWDVLQMEFDRCSGEFFCPKILEMHPSYPNVGGGVAYSPDSRWLYISFSTELYQVSSGAIRRGGAIPKLIGVYDGFWNFFATTFYCMQLAPDNKIYVSCTNGVRSMHRINAPNEAGEACDFQQHSIHFSAPAEIGISHFPVYRLYDQPHSICDTLGIDAPSGREAAPGWVPQKGVTVYPNPATDYIYLAVSPCDFGRLRIVNAEGQLFYEIEDWNGPQGIELSVQTWPSGMYFIQLYRYHYGVIQEVEKLVIMR